MAGNARISVAVVDDATIAVLNRQFLRHEGPTDVLSFLLEQDEDGLEGEVVVSAETARRTAPRFGWSEGEELLLYVIHGTLHLAGYDDAKPREQRADAAPRGGSPGPAGNSRPAWGEPVVDPPYRNEDKGIS